MRESRTTLGTLGESLFFRAVAAFPNSTAMRQTLKVSSQTQETKHDAPASGRISRWRVEQGESRPVRRRQGTRRRHPCGAAAPVGLLPVSMVNRSLPTDVI